MPEMPDSGQMTWAEAVAGPLADATCLWQDLDGLHVSPAPRTAPPTSIMWAWRDGPVLIRLRLDGDAAFVALHSGDGPAVRTLPWTIGPNGGGDHRVAARREAHGSGGSVGAVYEQVVVEGPGDGTGPVTFVRPAGRTA